MGVPPPVKMNDQSDTVSGKIFEGEEKSDNAIFSHPLDFLCCFSKCFIVSERVNVVLMYFGSYYGTIGEPGFYCRNSCIFEAKRISTALRTIDLPNIKVVDANGSPLICSGIVSYKVTDARKASIRVANVHKYVADLAPAVFKRAVASYPYEARGDDNCMSLRSNTEEICQVMRDALHQRCSLAGVRIESFSIDELSYAPEIAQAMLKRQQAEAIVDARKAIVEGAKRIAVDTVSDLHEHVCSEDRSKLLSNMLVVLVGQQDVTPTINLA